jgi:hypothetical protein
VATLRSPESTTICRSPATGNGSPSCSHSASSEHVAVLRPVSTAATSLFRIGPGLPNSHNRGGISDTTESVRGARHHWELARAARGLSDGERSISSRRTHRYLRASLSCDAAPRRPLPRGGGRSPAT